MFFLISSETSFPVTSTSGPSFGRWGPHTKSAFSAAFYIMLKEICSRSTESSFLQSKHPWCPRSFLTGLCCQVFFHSGYPLCFQCFWTLLYPELGCVALNSSTVHLTWVYQVLALDQVLCWSLGLWRQASLCPWPPAMHNVRSSTNYEQSGNDFLCLADSRKIPKWRVELGLGEWVGDHQTETWE